MMWSHWGTNLSIEKKVTRHAEVLDHLPVKKEKKLFTIIGSSILSKLILHIFGWIFSAVYTGIQESNLQ